MFLEAPYTHIYVIIIENLGLRGTLIHEYGTIVVIYINWFKTIIVGNTIPSL